MEFSKELIKKTKECRTVEELMALAKKNEIELTKEDAEALFGEFREGEVSDEELDNVSGGQEGCAKPANPYEVILWDTEKLVQYLFNIGDHVEAFGFGCKHHTATCTVKNRRATAVYGMTKMEVQYLKGYIDEYYLEENPGVKTVFKNGWYDRSGIEK